ncbi:hypothetical protein F2Q68_00008464 [Brassica cretica]|uniref:Uncharacterized protein n=1 Tax=Brassica cretica TaxID=69181 RepID=A0A8S9KXQ0_BRACR|nr:hypothetical protein F2Q68_00008464 [Brassica cretica]
MSHWLACVVFVSEYVDYFGVFGIVDRFRGVSVRTADIGHWELFVYELYHLCTEVELFGDSSEMELSLCDVILENDWLS